MRKLRRIGLLTGIAALIVPLLLFLLPAGVNISTDGNVSITLGEYEVLASPGEVTYYFDAYGAEEWTTTPEYMVDNVPANYASTTVNNQVERLTNNTCPGDGLDTITKVEVRAYAHGDGDDELYIRPEFTGGTGDNHITVPGETPDWGAYQNITNDTNAPDWSLWSHIQNLECDIEYDKTGSGAAMYVSKVEIRVTYGTEPKGGSIAFVRATEGTSNLGILTLNIEVSAGTDRVLVVGVAYRSGSTLEPVSIVFNTSEDFTVELSAMDGGDAQCLLYYLAAPTETTADVVVTLPSAVRTVGYVAYFTGVDQTNPFSIFTSEAMGTNNAPTVDVASAADEIVIDIMAQVSAGPDTIDSNSGTLICSGAATGGGSDCRGGGQYQTGEATTTMLYGMSSTDNWNIIAGALQEPGAGPDFDIGAAAIDRGSSESEGRTVIAKDNPASDSGTLHTVQVWAALDITGLRIGTFYTTNGNTLKCRDSEAIAGTITAGSKVTKAVSITVVTGDYIGCYYTGGLLERDNSGFSGIWWVSGEYIDSNDETEYTFFDLAAISLIGYGDTDGAVPDITSAPNTWTLNGITESGVIIPDTIYYANPQGDTQAPASTVADADCRFTVTNSSTMAIDLTCTMGAFTGGDGDMTNSNNGTNGATTFGAHSWFSGQLYANKVIIQSSGSSVGYDGLAATTDIMWGAEVETRTNAWTGGSASTATLTITATVD